MKKYILVLPMLVLMIASVFAFDFSVRGNDERNIDGWNYKTKINVWHVDGRLAPSNIGPQGQGTIEMMMYSKGYRTTFNANFKETSSTFSDSKAYINAHAKGTYWYKGIIPMPLTIDVYYIYDKDSNTITFNPSFMGSNMIISVK